MRVHIGPYLDWWGPYQLAGLLKYLGASEDRCRGIGKKLSKTVLNNICEWIHSKRKRKIKIKIDSYDTWSSDHTLALIVLPMLKQLKETKHGSPGDMLAFQQTSNQFQGTFDFYAEGDEAAWNAGHEEWAKILDEMIWAFEQLIDDKSEEQFWKQKPKLDLKKYPEDEGQTTIPLRWEVEGICDWDGLTAHNKRIQNGLELFGKYFQGLGD